MMTQTHTQSVVLRLTVDRPFIHFHAELYLKLSVPTVRESRWDERDVIELVKTEWPKELQQVTRLSTLSRVCSKLL